MRQWNGGWYGSTSRGNGPTYSTNGGLMAIVKIARERVKPGQIVRHNGKSYRASANANGYLYMTRDNGGRTAHHECARTSESMIEILTPNAVSIE
jgi:hypothetical protein